jgi:hypothetical protein
MRFVRLFVLFLVVCLFLGYPLIHAPIVARASPGTEIRVVNPLTGNSLFSFTTSTKNVGDAFMINITVVDAVDMASWQIRLTWDSALLSFVNISLPSDHVFAGRSIIVPPPYVEAGSVIYGTTLFPSGQPAFSGSGSLCQIALNITQGVDRQSPFVSCPLALRDADTFLLDSQSHDILYTASNGRYEYSWVAPSYNPTIYVKPAFVMPGSLGAVFALEIWMRNVSVDWSITGVQFSLSWNTSLIVPAVVPDESSYYEEGTFFETYGGIIYTAEINEHDLPSPLTPLPDDYNYSSFLISRSSNVPPFPSGEGRVMTVYFQAIFEAAYADPAYTMIHFITEDTFPIDTLGMNVPVSAEDCLYEAPIEVLNPEHDVVVSRVAASRLVVGQGGCIDVDIVVRNNGLNDEDCNVTLYADGFAAASEQNLFLENWTETTLTFLWNTTGLAVGNYTLWAYVDPVQGETNLGNNNFTMHDYVFMTFRGDVTGIDGSPDGKVDMRDVGTICDNFGKTHADLGWDPNMDLNDDGTVNMRDIGVACNNFGKHV